MHHHTGTGTVITMLGSWWYVPYRSSWKTAVALVFRPCCVLGERPRSRETVPDPTDDARYPRGYKDGNAAGNYVSGAYISGLYGPSCFPGVTIMQFRAVLRHW